MKRHAKCKVEDCHARAWHDELCNLHALERHRSKAYRPRAERIAEGKRLLRQRARELGITLGEPAKTVSGESETKAELVTATSRQGKGRSPVS